MQNQSHLAINGGPAVRKEPLPLEFSGAYFYGKEELENVTQVLKAKSPFRYYGFDLQRMTERFERSFSRYVGSPYVLGVNSGTAALVIALTALDVGPGDEVILPGYLWISTVAAVVRLGAIPVLADIDESYCLDPVDMERKRTERTKAVIMVHMSGTSGRVEAIASFCRKEGIGLIEDVAQAAGAAVGRNKLGSFGDLSIFSFQLNKTMTTGEGGAVCARTRELYERAFAAHDLGYARNEAGRLDLSNLAAATWGCGSRMSEVTAALALAQLGKLDAICARMRTAKWMLRERLSTIPGLEFRSVADPAGDAGNFLMTRFPSEEDAAFYASALRAEGIVPASGGISNIRMTDWGLHIYYNIPGLVHKLPVSARQSPWTDPRNAASAGICYDRGTLPKCDDLISRTLLLCIPPSLDEPTINDIVESYRKVAAARPLV